MQFLIISIICSVTVSVLFKLSRKYNIDLGQAVAINYIVAIVCTWYFLKTKIDMVNWSQYSQHWELFLGLGVLFPFGFAVLGRAVEQVGMVKADAAQRLSVFLPILAAFIFFDEVLTVDKIIGIILAFIALGFLLSRPANVSTTGKEVSVFRVIIWLLAVWLCYGFVDIILKLLSKNGQALPVILFLAFILSAVFIFSYLFISKTHWTAASILMGLTLGSLNFANISNYLYAHQFYSKNPTLVFAGMNLGVIVLATLVGVVVFKERITGLNIIGIFLALTALICLFYGNDFQQWLKLSFFA